MRNLRKTRKAAGLGLVFVLLWLFLPTPLFSAQAEGSGFHAALTEAEGRAGDTVEVSVSYDGSQGPVGAFFLTLEFDPAVFEYVRVRELPAVQDAYSSTVADEGRVRSACAMKRAEDALIGPEEVFSYVFRTLETAEPGETEIVFSLYDAADPDGERLNGAEESQAYTVLPPYSDDASLLSLTPEAGTLEPAFSPDCFSYALTVPFERTSLTFTAEPAEGAVCKVNRKNLGAGGSDTVFLFTVTAEDRQTKAVYRVTVHRQEKPSPVPTAAPTPKPKSEKTPSPEKTPKPQKTPKPSGEESSKALPDPSSSETGAKVSSSRPAPAEYLSGTSGSSPEPKLPETAVQENGTPAITIRNGEESFLPAVLGLVGFVLVVLFSDPLSKWLCRKFHKHK